MPIPAVMGEKLHHFDYKGNQVDPINFNFLILQRTQPKELIRFCILITTPLHYYSKNTLGLISPSQDTEY